MQSATCEVHIEDFSVQAILLMLQYMYGCLPELPRDHSQVLSAYTLFCLGHPAVVNLPYDCNVRFTFTFSMHAPSGVALVPRMSLKV
jgi:hypothetical protein